MTSAQDEDYEYGPDSLSPSVVDGDPSRPLRTSDPGEDPGAGAVEEEAPRSRAALSEAEVAAKIRSLEERLDEMIERSEAVLPAPETPPPSRFASVRALPPEPDATVFDTARELLSTEFYLRKWGRLGMRNRSEEVDDFGKDPVYEQKVRPFFDFLYDRYFRVETEGIGKIPGQGRCLLVANHSGTLPYDGMMI